MLRILTSGTAVRGREASQIQAIWGWSLHTYPPHSSLWWSRQATIVCAWKYTAHLPGREHL